MVIFEGIILAFSLLALIKGSEILVKSAGSLAKELGVSDFAIGLTFVAVGTSLPELASALAATLAQQNELIIGNVLGSNIANIGLILGIAALIAPLVPKRNTIDLDGYLMIFSVLLLSGLAFDGEINWIDALIFLLLYSGYIIYLFEEKSVLEKRYQFKYYLWYIIRFKAFRRATELVLNFYKNNQQPRLEKPLRKKLLRHHLLLAFFSIAAVAFGAHYTIIEAVFFAEMLKIPKEIVGMLLIAIGTSLPELSVSISAALVKRGEIAIGNIIGSNIANILLILGISGLVHPITFNRQIIYFVFPFLIFISLLFILLIRKEAIKRSGGFILIASYALFLIMLVQLLG